ncbi:unnamed protein product [Effrenium voratum]|nr:unnamed protein product [Effrenium voratum]
MEGFDWKRSLQPVQRGSWEELWDKVEVKNTFLHFLYGLDDEGDEEPQEFLLPSALRRTASEPRKLSSEAEDADASTAASSGGSRAASGWGTPQAYEDKQVAHLAGRCRPCGYFQIKGDGCRRGDDCIYCHLCTDEA